MIVVRRKTPRHDGTRYFAKPHPVQSHVEHAAKFDTPEAAETARRTLREPWLWEAMPEEEAAKFDAQEMAQHRKQMTSASWREKEAMRLYTALAVAASGIDCGPVPRG